MIFSQCLWSTPIQYWTSPARPWQMRRRRPSTAQTGSPGCMGTPRRMEDVRRRTGIPLRHYRQLVLNFEIQFIIQNLEHLCDVLLHEDWWLLIEWTIYNLSFRIRIKILKYFICRVIFTLKEIIKIFGSFYLICRYPLDSDQGIVCVIIIECIIIFMYIFIGFET